MPELPEVETICRDLNAELPGKTIRLVKVLDRRVIRAAGEKEFVRVLTGNVFSAILRRGKALIFELGIGSRRLVVQPMMTGQLVVVKHGTGVQRSCRIVLGFEGGEELQYNDQRVFGRWQLVGDPGELPYFRRLGPEPLSPDFSSGEFYGRLRASQRPVKPLLLDHAFVAGIGNIYASEILFEAGIDPRRRASSLSKSEAERVFQSMRKILKEAIRLRGSSVNTYVDGRGLKGKFVKRIRVYGREEEKCPGCGAGIRKIVQSQRSTFYCSNCQQ